MGEKEKENSDKYFSLYLGEVGFGTKVYDERSMKGLALGLEVNGLASKVQNVFIVGGAIPEIPPYTSKGKGLTDKQNILGMVDKKENEEPSISEQLLVERLKTNYEKDYYSSRINTESKRKIESLEDAFTVAEKQLGILGKVLPKTTPIRIKAGEEDIQNIMDIRMTKIKAAEEEKTKQMTSIYDFYTSQYKEIENKSVEPHIMKYSFNRVLSEDVLQKRNEKVKDYRARIKKELKTGVGNILKNNYPEIKGKDKTELLDRAVQKISWGQTQESLKQNYEKYENQFNELKESKKSIEGKLKAVNRNLDWRTILGKRASVSKFINQFEISPAESELYWASAKEEYSKMYGSIKTTQPLFFHVTGRKEIDTSKEVQIDEETGKKVYIEREDLVSAGKKIALIHNVKEISSNSLGPRGLKTMKDLSNKNNILYDKMQQGRENADILLSSHDSGGFRVQPWPKKTEKDLEGTFHATTEISYLISLPTFQSMKMLDWAVAHNISTSHTKRYEQGPWASAAIMHEEGDMGQNRFKIWENEDLIEWGKAAEAIDVYKNSLKSDSLGEEERRNLRTLIRENESIAKIEMKKIETGGDYHLGHAANKDRYSGDQFIEASQEYQLRTGLPILAVWDEAMHGIQTRYGATADYRADIPPIFKKKMEDLEKRTDISWEEKFDMLTRESLRNQRAIPVFNISKQQQYVNEMFVDYGLGIVNNGGRVAYVSGNHNNKSRPLSDEAIELSLQYPKELREAGSVLAIDGMANDVGVGYIPMSDGKSLYVNHKFHRGQDEIYGIMTHLRKMNSDADMVFAGDAHQSGAGYADGHIVTLHPGYQAQNKYVQTPCGQPAGVRGFENVFYDPTKKGVYDVEFVLDNTLEQIIKEKNIR